MLLLIQMKLKKELLSFFKGEVFDSNQKLTQYSRDASLFEVQPLLAVAPKNSSDLQKLVAFVNKKKNLSLTGRAGGSDMTGGPLTESIVVDFKHFNKIKKIGKTFAVVEPGVYYRDFERKAKKKGLLFPSYPASKNLCAWGGMVANNAGGEKTLAYGKTEDYIQELKVVLSNGHQYTFKDLNKAELAKKLKQKDFEGQIYRRVYSLVKKNKALIQKAKPRVSKNSSGYYLWNVWDGRTFNLANLFVGSQGTLGLITEIKVGLIKPKKHSKLLVIFLNDLKPLGKIVNEILKYNPESFESYDDNTLKLGMRYLFWQFAFQFLPELGMVLRGGLPQLVLIAEFTGDSIDEVDQKALAAQQDIAHFKLPTRITKNAKETAKYWTVRRESFNLLRQKIKDKQTAPFIDDIVVRPEKLPQFLPQLKKILNKYDITYTIAGHVGNGNFHIIPLMNLADEKSGQIITELSKEVYALVFKFEGSMSAEHNDGLIRTPFMQKMYGRKMYQLFKEIKKIFDPNNIFNPGKKVDGKLSYAIKHLKKK